MLKNKTIEYIFGMITGIAVTITFWACTQNPLNASGDSSSGGTYQLQVVDVNNYYAMNTDTGQLYRKYNGSHNDWEKRGTTINP